MKVTTEHTSDCNAIVTVEVDEEQISRAMKGAASRVSRIRPIPGFRPGKAPYEMVERIVGKELLRDEAIDEVAKTIYKQVLKDEKIEPYDSGKLDIPQKDPLVLKFTIPTRPVITLGDYRMMPMKPREVVVNDDEVNETLERLQKENAQLVPVTRTAQWDDMLTVNIKGGFEVERAIDREGMTLALEKDKSPFPWIEQLIGVNANEPRTVEYKYSEDDATYAGKTVTYSVTVTDIKEPSLPPLDDEFAKSISQYETLGQFKNYIRATLRAQKETEEENRFADEVVDTLIEKSQIAYPASMLEDELKLEVERAKSMASQMGMTWEKYLQLVGKSEEAFANDQRPRAEKRVKRLLTLLEFMKAEKIEITRKEVDVEIDLQAQYAERTGGKAAQVRRTLSSPASRKDIEWRLKISKAVDRLVAIVKGEPTSGKILTPEMVREELRQRELADRAAAQPASC